MLSLMHCCNFTCGVELNRGVLMFSKGNYFEVWSVYTMDRLMVFRTSSSSSLLSPMAPPQRSEDEEDYVGAGGYLYEKVISCMIKLVDPNKRINTTATDRDSSTANPTVSIVCGLEDGRVEMRMLKDRNLNSIQMYLPLRGRPHDETVTTLCQVTVDLSYDNNNLDEGRLRLSSRTTQGGDLVVPLIVSGSLDGSIKVWEVTSEFRCVNTFLSAHHGGVRKVISLNRGSCYNGNQTAVMVASLGEADGGVIKIWDVLSLSQRGVSACIRVMNDVASTSIIGRLPVRRNVKTIFEMPDGRIASGRRMTICKKMKSSSKLFQTPNDDSEDEDEMDEEYDAEGPLHFWTPFKEDFEGKEATVGVEEWNNAGAGLISVESITQRAVDGALIFAGVDHSRKTKVVIPFELTLVKLCCLVLSQSLEDGDEVLKQAVPAELYERIVTHRKLLRISRR